MFSIRRAILPKIVTPLFFAIDSPAGLPLPGRLSPPFFRDDILPPPSRAGASGEGAAAAFPISALLE